VVLDDGSGPGDGGAGGTDPGGGEPAWCDAHAFGALPHASPGVAAAWRATTALSSGDAPPVGLAAGERPAADVDVLAGLMAAAEYELARRMHAAHAAGCLPMVSPGGMLAARGWAMGTSRRLARCGALAATHASVAGPWAAGVITSEHVDPIARHADRFTPEELVAVIAELVPHWGAWSPTAIARFVEAADRLLHPSAGPTPGEVDAYEARHLAFSVTADAVLVSATLPRVEGELVIAAIDALAERLRSTADLVPAGVRRADALVELVNAAASSGTLPSRGGLPVALTVTLDHTSLGDPVWRTGRGHHCSDAEARWAACDAVVTPVATGSPAAADGACDGTLVACDGASVTPAARIAALAALLFDARIPLAVGRIQRTATPAQRRALAVRDGGCLIPGCGVPAEACQAHHLTEWAAGGATDLPNLALLCWAHHRQVDLGMWTITPGPPSGESPSAGARPGTAWPANHGAPFTITRTPRHTWRL
jgi:hypothetical protein